MGRMKELLDQRLEENKYDLYEAVLDILPELKEYVTEVGDWDYSVGIYFCGLFNKIDNLERVLTKIEKL